MRRINARLSRLEQQIQVPPKPPTDGDPFFYWRFAKLIGLDYPEPHGMTAREFLATITDSDLQRMEQYISSTDDRLTVSRPIVESDGQTTEVLLFNFEENKYESFNDPDGYFLKYC